MVVAEVFHSAFSVRSHLFDDGLVTCDEQASTLVVECLHCWPCKYVTFPVLADHSLKYSCVSFLAYWYHLNELWEWTKFLQLNTFVSPLAAHFCKLTSSVQRAALRDAWGAHALRDPLTSTLADYENMWSLVETSHSLENNDK